MCKPEAPLSPTLLRGVSSMSMPLGAPPLFSVCCGRPRSHGITSDGAIRGRPYQDLSALSLSGLATSILPLHWSSDGKLDTVLLPSRSCRFACGDKSGEPTHTGTRMPAPRTPSGRSSSTRAGDRVQLAHALPARDLCFPHSLASGAAGSFPKKERTQPVALSSRHPPRRVISETQLQPLGGCHRGRGLYLRVDQVLNRPHTIPPGK